jgi:gluconokinase
MSSATVLAIDIGTSSIRASVYDGRLRLRRSVRVKYRWRMRSGGIVEADPDRLARLTASAIDEVLQEERRSIDVATVAAFWHSLVGADRDGRAVTPLIPWSDLRAADAADDLRSALNERSLHARTGCRLHASYWPARLSWFRRHEPRLSHRVHRWMSFGEWLDRRWLQRDGVSMSQASGTGLFNQHTAVWDRETLDACGIDPSLLGPIVDLADDGARLHTRLRTRWPQLQKTRWIPAVGDGAANNVGAGCATRTRAAVMIGTSGALRLLWEPRPSEKIRVPSSLWRYRLDRRRIVVGGASSSGGNIREWLLRVLAADPRLDAKAAALAPAAHRLTMVPLLAGSRSPDYFTRATGTIRGLTLATRPEHVLRAAMESIAYDFARILRDLTRVADFQEIVAAGGALERSAVWAQMLADVFDRPLLLCRERELTSRGAAALGLEALGVLKLDDLQPPRARRLTPNRARHLAYAPAADRQYQLLRKLHA